MGKRHSRGRSDSFARSRHKRKSRPEAHPAPFNAVSPARLAERSADAARDSTRAGESALDPRPGRAHLRGQWTHAMPPQIRQRFIPRRNVYYFPGGGRAFVDHGDELRTRSEDRHVIQSLAAIARIRGWRAISVSGTDRFKQQLWLAARLAGLAVRGYRPAAHVEAQFERKSARHARRAPAPVSQIELPDMPERMPERSSPSTTLWPIEGRTHAAAEWHGRLIEHGPAPYRHEPANSPSYFVKLRTRNGEQLLWGVDLKRALRASASQPVPGDAVVLRRIRQNEVRVPAPALRAGRERPEESSRKTHRHRYWIEQRAFIEERGRLARVLHDASVSAQVGAHRHPALAPIYLQLRAAQLIADRLLHPEDQRSFVHLVRHAVAESLARGAPVSTLALRVRARDVHPKRPDRVAAPSRG